MKQSVILALLVATLSAGAQYDTAFVSEKTFISLLPDLGYLHYDTTSVGVKKLVRIAGPIGWDVAIFAHEASGNKVFSENIEVGCGDYVIRYQGYDYSTVKIGEQCWFAENLQAMHYTNGDEIPLVPSTQQWEGLTSGAQIVYGFGTNYCSGNCDESENLLLHGRLYNWYAITDERGVCPTGWRIPSSSDWEELTGYVGFDNAGNALKALPTDVPAFDGTNDFGFNGAAGGVVDDGNFNDNGVLGNWWSTSMDPTGEYPYFFELYMTAARAQDSYTAKTWGLSVRCVEGVN